MKLKCSNKILLNLYTARRQANFSGTSDPTSNNVQSETVLKSVTKVSEAQNHRLMIMTVHCQHSSCKKVKQSHYMP
jgi:hypothetical protein